MHDTNHHIHIFKIFGAITCRKEEKKEIHEHTISPKANNSGREEEYKATLKRLPRIQGYYSRGITVMKERTDEKKLSITHWIGKLKCARPQPSQIIVRPHEVEESESEDTEDPKSADYAENECTQPLPRYRLWTSAMMLLKKHDFSWARLDQIIIITDSFAKCVYDSPLLIPLPERQQVMPHIFSVRMTMSRLLKSTFQKLRITGRTNNV